MIDRIFSAAGILLTLVVVAGLVGWQELQLSQSETLYLPLAPVDPRSLVQGDFMRLRYAIESELRSAQPPLASPSNPYETLESSGVAVIALDERSVASFARIADGAALASNERQIGFTHRDWETIVASRAYLFQEGTADVYAPAKYGIMALTPSGGLALVGLADEELRRLGPAPKRW